MKPLLILSLLLVLTFAVRADHVNGYTTKNGTYVAPHERTSANGTTSDNYSHEGNVNPYTGEEGHKK
jgi:hypothetical protein